MSEKVIENVLTRVTEMGHQTVDCWSTQVRVSMINTALLIEGVPMANGEIIAKRRAMDVSR